MGMGNVNNASGRDNRDLNNAAASEDASNGDDSIESRLIAMNTSGSRPPLTFHAVCGENVRIQKQGRVAKRVESFCKGLAFSARPIEVNEIVVMKLAETATNWSGVLRFGVTNTNPQTLQNSLPKYACPDLTNKEGNWAKALTERYCQMGNLIHFYVLVNGELHYGINGVQKGLYLSGINCSQPMWVLLDIYGNSNCVEFIDPSDVPSLRSAARSGPSGSGATAAAVGNVSSRTVGNTSGTLNRPASTIAAPLNNAQQQQPTTSSTVSAPSRRASENAQALATAQVALELNQRLAVSTSEPPAGQGPLAGVWQPFSAFNSQQQQPASFAPRTAYPSLKYNCGLDIAPLEFHQMCGKHVSLSSDKCLATRNSCEYSGGYVFTKRPVRLNEKIIVQILKNLPQYSGSLTFGITSCDPITINPHSLPEDSDNLMDRKEYWVVNKDVAGSSLNELDELTFYLNDKGSVEVRPFRPPVNATSQPSFSGNDVRRQQQNLPVSRVPPVSQSSAPASPGVRQISYGQLHVQLPPPVPTLPRNQNRTISANSLPSLNSASSSSAASNNNAPSHYHGGGHRGFRGGGAHQQQPPPRPPPPHWQQAPVSNAPVISQADSSSTSGIVASSSSSMDAVAAGVANLNLAAVARKAPSSTVDSTLESGDECAVCMQNGIDCALYTCGHMCMCYTCAVETWQRHGFCPVCRQPIKDVIKTYKST